jgi:RNA polymerase sigma-70 factor (sigma-E family)
MGVALVTLQELLATELENLSRFARVLTGDREQAHDVLFDVLEKAQRGWPRIAELQQPAAYLRKMVLNQFLDERRKWSSRMIRPTRSGMLLETAAPDGLQRVDDRTELGSLLVSLPRQQRAAIVLRYYLDLSDSDIADALGCSPGAVRAHISRGLGRLRIATSTEPTTADEMRSRS